MRSSRASSDVALAAGLSAALLVGGVVAMPDPVVGQGPSPPPGADVPVDAATLLTAFSRMPGLEATFVEEKHLALLAAPLVSRGRIFFMRPGILLRRIEQPQRSEVLITPTELRIREPGHVEVIDLRSRADVRPFVESLVWILAGNRAALEDAYRIQLQPDPSSPGSWRLTLVPRRSPLDRIFRELRLDGTGLYVREIRVVEVSGDETITRILEANPARTYTDAEKRQLFGP